MSGIGGSQGSHNIIQGSRDFEAVLKQLKAKQSESKQKGNSVTTKLSTENSSNPKPKTVTTAQPPTASRQQWVRATVSDLQKKGISHTQVAQKPTLGKARSQVSEKAQNTADQTEHVAFNALEKFVGLFSKDQAKKMQDARLDNLENKVTEYVSKGESNKAMKTLVQLAGLSPTRFEESLTSLKDKFDTPQLTSLINQLPPDKFSRANQFASFTLGQSILKPVTTHDPNHQHMKYVSTSTSKPFEDPSKKDPTAGALKTAQDFWRAIPRFKIYEQGSGIPTVDGSAIKEGSKKDEQHSEKMRETLNVMSKHLTGSTKEFTKVDIGKTMNDAGNFGINFKDKVPKEDKEKLTRMLGLGAQELFTRPGSWAIPPEFGANTESELKVSEFRPDPQTAKQLEPFEYGRSISITLMKDGGLEYKVTQPVTFSMNDDQVGSKAIGLCLMETTMIFDNNIKCTSFTQEAKPANIKQE